MHRIPTLAALTTCLALGACGGGGGDSAPPPAVTQVGITSANQTEVARSVVSGGIALALAQPLGAPGRASALAATARGAALPVRTLAGVAQRVARLAGAQHGARRLQPLAASTDTDACSGGGTIASTYDDRDNNNDASVGDVLTVVFSQCQEADMGLIDGTVTLQVTSVGANTDTNLDLGATLAFDNVSASFGDTAATLAGSVAAAVAIRSDSTQVTMTVGSEKLRVGASAPDYAEAIVYESGMRISVLDSYGETTSSSYTLDGSYTSELLGGRLTVATSQPFLQLETDGFASSGQIVATGAAGSQLRVTVVDATRLRLELDADGNGSYEGNQVLGWSEVTPL